MEAATICDQQSLIEQLAQAREALVALAHDLRVLDDQLEGLATERTQHRLVLDACVSLDKLNELGGAHLFWGDGTSADTGAEHILRARSRVDVFNARVGAIEDRRAALVDEVREQQERTELLEDALFEAQDEDERRN